MAVKLKENERRCYERIWNIVRPLHAIAIELAGEKRTRNNHEFFMSRIVNGSFDALGPAALTLRNKQVNELIDFLYLRERIVPPDFTPLRAGVLKREAISPTQ